MQGSKGNAISFLHTPFTFVAFSKDVTSPLERGRRSFTKVSSYEGCVFFGENETALSAKGETCELILQQLLCLRPSVR
jgi:hypothetical protein